MPRAKPCSCIVYYHRQRGCEGLVSFHFCIEDEKRSTRIPCQAPPLIPSRRMSEDNHETDEQTAIRKAHGQACPDIPKSGFGSPWPSNEASEISKPAHREQWLAKLGFQGGFGVPLPYCLRGNDRRRNSQLGTRSCGGSQMALTGRRQQSTQAKEAPRRDAAGPDILSCYRICCRCVLRSLVIHTAIQASPGRARSTLKIENRPGAEKLVPSLTTPSPGRNIYNIKNGGNKIADT